MKNKPLNCFKNPVGWLISAARFSLTVLLLALLTTSTQAQIAIQDGLLALTSSGGGPTVTKAFTVTPGASVLVVMLINRQNATIIPEPATITWNGNTLTQDTNSLANASNYRSMSMFHLFNPPPGTGNIVATYAIANNSIGVEAFTLSGVDTTVAPIILQANSAGAVTSLSVTANGVPAGSWATVGSIWGAAGTFTAGGTGGTATGVAGTIGSSAAVAGYIANLSGGTVTIGVTNSASNKGVFIAEISAPGAPSPAIIASQPQSLTVFTNTTVKLTVGANGAAPLSYQWFTNNTIFPLSNGGNLTGATSSVLTISNTTLANAGNYFVVVSNQYGAATSSIANVTLTSPSGPYESAVVTNLVAPFAFYTFSETNDPSAGGVVAYDSIGAFNGIYGAASQNGFNGIAGPQAVADGLVGFSNANTALGTAGANSQVTLPPLNLNNDAGANLLTITAWIYPNGTEPNAAGIVFCRGGSTISGMAYLDNGVGTLGYNWNNEAGAYTWSSGLTPPPYVWSLVALVITPTNATVYLCNTNSGLLSSTHVYNHVVQKFDAPTFIGFESFNASRVFNGSLDEVGLYSQALTLSQVGTLFAAASGNPPIVAKIPTDPIWAPATVYAAQSASITVNAGGSTPLFYQWQAGAVGSGIYTNVTNGGSVSEATSATLAITNAQSANNLDYVVRVSNAYGAVTSTVPATLTVLDPGPPTTFTLNYPAAPVQQGIGADWNSLNVWAPLALPASTLVFANPGSTFEVVVGSRMRNPQGTTYNAFPGDILQIDGDGIFENNAVAAVGEIRFKNTNPAVPSTNYFKNLVLNGGQLNIGDSTDVILQGAVTVATNSTLYALGVTGVNQTFRIDSYLAGSGTMQLYLSNGTPSAALVITGNSNTFTGKWDIEQGPLVGIGVNSLGTNTITIGQTNGMLETSYPINNSNASLVLNGRMFLTQNDTFKSVYVNGTGLAPGTYSAPPLSATYPGNFPATFIALYGTTATNASGQITVLAGGAPILGPDPTWTLATLWVGQTSSITLSSVIGTGPLSYQWMAGAVGSGSYADLHNGGNISGATSATLTIAGAQLANDLDYVVRVSNAFGSVTSTVPATLTVGDSAPFLVTDISPNPATFYAGFTATLTATFDGSRPIAYQWVTDGGSGAFTNVNGATNSTLVLANVQAGSAGNYYLMATSLAGQAASGQTLLTVVPSTHAIHFGPTNAITTANAVLNHPGVVAGAAVFGTTAEVVTLGNGSKLTFTADGSVASVDFGNAGAFAFPAPNTTGNPNFDAVLNQVSADIGPKTITLNNLVAGHNYSVLLIALDDRGLPSVAGSAPARLAYFQDPVVPNDVSSTFHMGDSVYVMASFLAETATQTIIEQLPTANSGNMNALVVYDLSLVVAPPTLNLARSGGRNLTLTWSPGSTLLQSTNLLGPWITNNTAASPYTVSPTNAQTFFRVRTP